MIAYAHGIYDILRAKDLQELDKQIQLSIQEGANYFGIGIYDANLCSQLGLNTPLKSLEDRLNIMRQIRGVDFVFPVSSLHEDILRDAVKNGFLAMSQNNTNSQQVPKQYELGYAPGTYDLFHAGHLENLTIASSYCDSLIVGVKSDELVEEHKHRKPVISAEERMEILRHFKFVYDVYKYHTRDLRIANAWAKSKYRHPIDAIFLGSDLEKDFADTQDLNIIYTPRDKEGMKTRSTTAYRTLILNRDSQPRYTGHIPTENQKAPNIVEEPSIDDDIQI